MSQNFLFKASFFTLLMQIDSELADNTLKEGCPRCGGPLHLANYPRSPFGLPKQFRRYCDERISFCCAQCRKRTTPPSVRFFGRRWFVAPVFILLSLLMLGINERRLAQIKQHFGISVSESTWKRWRAWWRQSFQRTKFWLQAKGSVISHLQTNLGLPRALLRLFPGSLIEKIPKLLQFFSPLTAGSLCAI